MRIKKAKITLVDRLLFRHRELDKLVETSTHIHNYALTYSIFNGVGRPLVDLKSLPEEPRYSTDLQKARKRGFYITPANPVDVSYTIETTNVKSEKYVESMSNKRGKTYPSGHKLKLADIGSEYIAYLFLDDDIGFKLPHNIRLGKLMTKAKVEWSDLQHTVETDGFKTKHPLNPMDLPREFKDEVKSTDYIRMSPTGLIKNVSVRGYQHYSLNDEPQTKMPVGMGYMEYDGV